MSDVAVVGVGDLGMACALRLNELGLEVSVVEPDAARREQWRRDSGREALASLDGLASERVLVCVRTTGQAHAVLSSLAAQPRERTCAVYVITTLQPAFARRLEEYAGPQMPVIELPISGGQAGARRGDLAVMVGGGLARPQDIAFITDTLARVAFKFEQFGDATVVKLLNNALGAANAAAFADCISLAQASGIDPVACAAVLRSATGSSWMAENFEVLIDDLLAKDVSLLRDELGRVPVARLSDTAAFEASMASARRLLTDSPREP